MKKILKIFVAISLSSVLGLKAAAMPSNNNFNMYSGNNNNFNMNNMNMNNINMNNMNMNNMNNINMNNMNMNNMNMNNMNNINRINMNNMNNNNSQLEKTSFLKRVKDYVFIENSPDEVTRYMNGIHNNIGSAHRIFNRTAMHNYADILYQDNVDNNRFYNNDVLNDMADCVMYNIIFHLKEYYGKGFTYLNTASLVDADFVDAIKRCYKDNDPSEVSVVDRNIMRVINMVSLTTLLNGLFLSTKPYYNIGLVRNDIERRLGGFPIEGDQNLQEGRVILLFAFKIVERIVGFRNSVRSNHPFFYFLDEKYKAEKLLNKSVMPILINGLIFPEVIYTKKEADDLYKFFIYLAKVSFFDPKMASDYLGRYIN